MYVTLCMGRSKAFAGNVLLRGQYLDISLEQGQSLDIAFEGGFQPAVDQTV